MRAKEDFTYIIDSIPTPHSIFQFIQDKSDNDDREMYGNFNMGAGFAIFLPQRDVSKAIEIANTSHSMHALDAGYVQDGPRQVVIQPKNLTHSGESLEVR